MKNFVSIESLRAWMAWWVVVGHALHLCGGKDLMPKVLYGLLTRGSTAVNVFIIVSGFVIAHLLIQKSESYKAYIIRRAFRLFPIYIFCIIIAISIEYYYIAAYTSPWVVAADMRLDRIGVQWQHFWPHAFAHLTMLHGVFPDNLFPYSSTSFLAPAWSLSLEWQFYLVAPLIIALVLRGGTALMAIVGFCMALFLVFSQKTLSLGHWNYPSFLPLSINYFLVGILSRVVLEKGRLEAISVICLVGISALFTLEAELFIWGFFYTVVLIEQGIVLGPKSNSIVDWGLRMVVFNRLIQNMGRWSYSTYLIHIPVFAVFVGIGKSEFGLTSQIHAVILTFISFPTIFLLSRFMYQFVEMPGITVGRSLVKRLAPSKQ